MVLVAAIQATQKMAALIHIRTLDQGTNRCLCIRSGSRC